MNTKARYLITIAILTILFQACGEAKSPFKNEIDNSDHYEVMSISYNPFPSYKAQLVGTHEIEIPGLVNNTTETSILHIDSIQTNINASRFIPQNNEFIRDEYMLGELLEAPLLDKDIVTPNMSEKLWRYSMTGNTEITEIPADIDILVPAKCEGGYKFVYTMYKAEIPYIAQIKNMNTQQIEEQEGLWVGNQTYGTYIRFYVKNAKDLTFYGSLSLSQINTEVKSIIDLSELLPQE